jgi:hypothetical protein
VERIDAGVRDLLGVNPGLSHVARLLLPGRGLRLELIVRNFLHSWGVKLCRRWRPLQFLLDDPHELRLDQRPDLVEDCGTNLKDLIQGIGLRPICAVVPGNSFPGSDLPGYEK